MPRLTVFEDFAPSPLTSDRSTSPLPTPSTPQSASPVPDDSDVPASPPPPPPPSSASSPASSAGAFVPIPQILDCTLFTLVGALSPSLITVTLTGHVNVYVPLSGVITFPVLLTRTIPVLQQPAVQAIPSSPPPSR